MDAILFGERLSACAAACHCTAATADTLARELPRWPAAELGRLNPLAAARRLAIDSRETTDLMLCAARRGLLDLTWSLVCPTCGGILSAVTSVDRLEQEPFHCALCHLEVPVVLDDHVEVTFSVNPTFQPPAPDPYGSYEAFRQRFFSAAFHQSPAVAQYLEERSLAFLMVPPGETLRADFTLPPGSLVRVVSIAPHSGATIQVCGEPLDTPQQAKLDIDSQGFQPAHLALRPGPTQVTIRNRAAVPVGAKFVLTDFALLHRLMREQPATWDPYFSGKMLLNSQVFRDQFRQLELLPDLAAQLRSLTLVFTDLHGSTALYEAVGDARAYRLIQQHFEVLGEAVSSHDGAVIKTMGDAVMASFSEPQQGLAAALDMRERLRALNAGLAEPLGLKLGLHEGPALAINNDGRLDYFGQTINLAARVQHLARRGEICVTANAWQNGDLARLAAHHGLQAVAEQVALKGLQERVTVYRCSLQSV